MQSILVVGAGKIGSLVAGLLADSDRYEVTLVDKVFQSDVKRLFEQRSNLMAVNLDLTDLNPLKQRLKNTRYSAIISCLPYFLNTKVATVAAETNTVYFDLTEDVSVTREIKKLAEKANTCFVPQCGLAPGFVSIAADHLMHQFDRLDYAKLRVGALPQHVNNGLQYALTWSTEGLINEYGNACLCIDQGKKTIVPPLLGIETLQIDGQQYEAFNTSGGLGRLCDTYEGRIASLNYKTIRYPGHCEKMRLLMNDFRLNEDRSTLKKILEKALPKTYQDVVIIYIAVAGWRNDEYLEETYCHKIYPAIKMNLQWSAIQVATASSVCAVVDLILKEPECYHGFVYQEQIRLESFLKNQFGGCYA